MPNPITTIAALCSVKKYFAQTNPIWEGLPFCLKPFILAIGLMLILVYVGFYLGIIWLVYSFISGLYGLFTHNVLHRSLETIQSLAMNYGAS